MKQKYSFKLGKFFGFILKLKNQHKGDIDRVLLKITTKSDTYTNIISVAIALSKDSAIMISLGYKKI